MRGLPPLAREAERVGAGGRAAGVGDVYVDRTEVGLDALHEAGAAAGSPASNTYGRAPISSAAAAIRS